MKFQEVREFLESWGLHYDTPEGESNDIPYPQVFVRMVEDAQKVGGDELRGFIENITDTTDSRTYLTPDSWADMEEAWNNK